MRDTALPKLVWEYNGRNGETNGGLRFVYMDPADGEETVRITFNDGLQRHLDVADYAMLDISHTVGVDGVLQNALDTGAAAADKFYYVYAVPASGAPQHIRLLASLKPPTPDGPADHAIWRYLGAIMTKTGGEIREFEHSDDLFVFNRSNDYTRIWSLASTGHTAGDNVGYDLFTGNKVPETAASAFVGYLADVDGVQTMSVGMFTNDASPTHDPAALASGVCQQLFNIYGNASTCGMREFPIFESHGYLYYNFGDVPSSVEFAVWCSGWRDSYRVR